MWLFLNLIIFKPDDLGHPQELPMEIKNALHFQKGEDEAVQHRIIY